jgi:TRAP-type mannitol/chloroaromatic compound transport system permease small subunit
MQRTIQTIDRINTAIGQLFGWSIFALTLVVTYEVFMRYVMKQPSGWGFDAAYMLYGLLFMMAGAYTLARNGHVRGDFLYRNWSPRTQARLDLTLYFIFFFPGILALIYSGWNFFHLSWMLNEKSSFSPDGLYLWPFKLVIPVTGVLMLFQGVAEVLRCIQCIKEGDWPPRLHDVEETEKLATEGAITPKTGELPI